MKLTDTELNFILFENLIAKVHQLFTYQRYP